MSRRTLGGGLLGLGAAVGAAGLFLPFHAVPAFDVLYGSLDPLRGEVERALWHVSAPLAFALLILFVAGVLAAVLVLDGAAPAAWAQLSLMAALVIATAVTASEAFRSRFEGEYTGSGVIDPPFGGVVSIPLDSGIGATFLLLALLTMLGGLALVLLDAERRRPEHEAPADG